MCGQSVRQPLGSVIVVTTDAHAEDVLREHRFTGDSRPFAVLGAVLPLAPPVAR